MYLKSLVLKGFKSFADRSVLVLEPGITAIVGPNGSGKSNISDAVLWVLGERSARNLRGQSMEDIIFSGSAARKAVSIAEVELVLDNSDHMLPVDYEEVVITRRMYRSGESEYLVNGAIVRRLDVLDILHDTGLGTGTHSIISQGSLDSILQSKPEDRRALIEEAAGVLKHKRRKEKSARKLEQMDNHLARVRDVTAEVARQLGPLERKAKRAEAYRKAQGELHEVRLALAVDDLRRLQREWESICEAERTATTDMDEKRREVDSAERKVNELQEIMRRESEDANVVARNQRRASSLSERLDSAERLLRERRRAALDSKVAMAEALDNAVMRRQEAVEELDSVQMQLSEVKMRCEESKTRQDEVSQARTEAQERMLDLENSLSGASRDLSDCERAWDRAKRSHAELQQLLANGVAQARLLETRKEELEAERATAQEQLDVARAALAHADADLAEATEADGSAQAQLIASFEERDSVHKERDGIQADLHMAQTERRGIEQALSALRNDYPAYSWVVKNSNRFGEGLFAVSRAFKVTRGLESLVEALLGHDLAALAVKDAGSARKIADALADEGVPGDMAMVMLEDGSALRAHIAAVGEGEHALIEDIDCPDDMRPIVEALLGDVVVCKDRESAFAAHARRSSAVRYLSLDGCVIWPSGKVQVLGPSGEASEGVIARERRLDEIGIRIDELKRDKERADVAVEAADEAYRSAQAHAMKTSQQLANCKGARESALSEEKRCAKRHELLVDSISQVQRQMVTADQELDSLRPNLQQASDEVDARAREHEELMARRESLSAAMEPLRRESALIDEKYADARLEAAQLAERLTYVERLVIARQRDLEALDFDARNAREGIAVKEAAARRASDALDVIAQLGASLARRVHVLDEALSASETNTSSVHANAASARDDARRAHDQYDAASALMAQVRVDKSRLEMRVEAALSLITEDLQTPIDQAQKLSVLEDRKGAEEESFKLERKIKNMGAINPDAAEEYAQVKERYDFLAGQLADMESARKSLKRIVKVIDERMRDDFVRTYEQVDRNFSEIFSELFPGGSAHLSFDDPDDIENTGVEVTAQPAGKRLTKMTLMSGGEKSLTALALLFAVYKTRTTPFYILDEVEAALDDTNLRRLAGYIDTLRNTTQLIMITHQRRTMEMADVLFGVSMHADGVTKVISQKLERALEQAE